MIIPVSPTNAAAAVARAATPLTVGAAAWTPRTTFEASASTPRSYYLGHHAAGLAKMRQALAHVGLIIECRDARAPLTTWNPLISSTLATADDGSARERIVIYTKRDLAPEDRAARRLLKDLHRPAGEPDGLGPGFDPAVGVVFSSCTARDRSARNRDRSTRDLLKRIMAVAIRRDCLTGLRCMVVGMPNAGKSSLVNHLRSVGMKKGKVARTGGLPGVTRKMSGPVRIALGEARLGPDDEQADGDDVGIGEGIFILDTPGVFMPYVDDAESMLKLALMGCVKEGLVPAVTLADYLLYQMNLKPQSPAALATTTALSPVTSASSLRQQYYYTTRFNMDPTNNVDRFLRAVALRTGKLSRGGSPNLALTASWLVHEFRAGRLGQYSLDDVTPESVARAVAAVRDPATSMHQARKKEKAHRKDKNLAKFAAARASNNLSGAPVPL